MTIGDMLIWTNRLKEVRGIKSASLQRQRMKNIKKDFVEAYSSDKGLTNTTKNYFVLKMYATIQSDFFRYV